MCHEAKVLNFVWSIFLSRLETVEQEKEGCGAQTPKNISHTEQAFLAYLMRKHACSWASTVCFTRHKNRRPARELFEHKVQESEREGKGVLEGFRRFEQNMCLCERRWLQKEQKSPACQLVLSLLDANNNSLLPQNKSHHHHAKLKASSKAAGGTHILLTSLPARRREQLLKNCSHE